MNAHLITGEKNNEPRIGVCDMFSTNNIVSVNNFYKRFASVFISIALMMMTSMLVACGKKEDIVHSQECNVIVEIGTSGYSLGDYENQNLVTYTFLEEELGSNEEIRQCLKQFINDNANADVVVAEYSLMVNMKIHHMNLEDFMQPMRNVIVITLLLVQVIV